MKWWKIAALAAIGWLAFEGFSDMTKQAAEASKGPGQTSPGATRAMINRTTHHGWLFRAWLGQKQVEFHQDLEGKTAALAYGNGWLAKHNAAGVTIEVSGVTIDG